MVTGHKDKKGEFHPHSGSSNGVSENDVKISVKGSNDTILVGKKTQTYKNSMTNKNNHPIIYKGKHTLLNTELPTEEQQDRGVVNFLNLKPNEKITYVVSKSDKDGHLFHHWENSDNRTIFWNGRNAEYAQHELARRTSAIAFRTDYRNGRQSNLNPEDFEGFRWD